MAEEKQCVLVIIGADEWGRKEIIDLADGYRESTQSWRELLLDLQRRGLSHAPNAATFAINQQLLAGWIAATDDNVRRAMRFAYDMFKIVVEPGAAVGIAAVLAGKIDITGKTIATVVTGGNIDPVRFCKMLATPSDNKENQNDT